MTSRRPLPQGAARHIAAQRLRAFRIAADLRLQDVVDRLTANGHELTLNSLSRMELGARRMDVDDLAALGRALDVPASAFVVDADRRGAARGYDEREWRVDHVHVYALNGEGEDDEPIASFLGDLTLAQRRAEQMVREHAAVSATATAGPA